ncbi:MAG: diacylglycerol kinase family lipid kinase [Alphaproteobacteria bacterium]|nr:MAG: diacylglycerol kinase family lipid kinase [Alphaproteobacteria bacterium]
MSCASPSAGARTRSRKNAPSLTSILVRERTKVSAARVHVIVNPKAAGGRTAKRWPKILNALTEKFGPITYSFTEARGDGTAKTRSALREGADFLIVVGGDGTFSECVNGFFEGGAPVNPSAQMAFITSGTGCDIRRAHDWPQVKDFAAMIDLIASGTTRPIDIGHIAMRDHMGNPTDRYFANAASFGVGGAVSHAVNTSHLAKKFGGTFAFLFHALREAMRFENQRVRIQIDENFDEEFEIILAVAALGPYFGGGLKIAPDASPTDGLFDFLIGHDITKKEIPGLISRVYSGKHINDPKVKMLRGRKLVATPLSASGKILMEVDGESPGALPATFTILPSALQIRG